VVTPLAEGQAQDRVSSPAKDWRSANCPTQPTNYYLTALLNISEAMMLAQFVSCCDGVFPVLC